MGTAETNTGENLFSRQERVRLNEVEGKAASAETPGDTMILATKLHIPRAAAETVTRRRLIDRINRGMGSKFTFLCAPAGFGKSTLLAHWAHQAEMRPAWYAVDRGDNDPARFWQYVTAAVDRIVPGFRERTADVIKLVQPSQYEVAIAMLLNELDRLTEPLTLVLDDFHTVSDEGLLASFAYFIDYLPEHVHVIAASRSEPAFPTARLVSRQWMTRIDTAELRFTEREGSEFYAGCMALELPEDEAGEWVRRTEGWITAMKLAALSLRGAAPTSAPLRGFFGSSSLLEQYLLEEVFMQQSEPVRRFLTDCSVLKRMSAPLCRAVAGAERSQEMLERLENAQLFTIPLDERKGWYRFHHLFSEFLYNRLQRREPERIPALLGLAGQWCEREGLQEEALDYYLTGGHYERGVALLEAMTSKRLRVGTVWLSGQFSRIPDHLLAEHPYLYFSYVHMLLLDAQYAKAEQMMRNAEVRYGQNRNDGSEQNTNDYWGSFYYLKMLDASIGQGDQEQALHYMRQSRQYKPTGTRLIFTQSKKAGLPSIAKEYVRSDKFVDKAMNISILTNMIQTLGEVGGSVLACLAEALYEYNELDEAEKTAANALDSAMINDPHIMSEILLPARLVLSRIRRAGGRFGEAAETMRQTRRDVIELGMTGSLIHCDAELALLALEEGDTAPAQAWMKLYRLGGGGEVAAGRLYEHQSLARMYVAQGRYDEAESLAESMLEAAKRADRVFAAIETSVLQLVLLHRTGRTDEALSRLRAILLASEPRGYVRVYLDAGEPVAGLLALLIETWDRLPEGERPSLGYVRGLLAGFGRTAAAGGLSSDLALILTQREQDIFRLIVAKRTNKEIAAELGIGYGTVRSHLNNIYGKLMVSGREEAIRKAGQ